jgi:hypothetical protein
VTGVETAAFVALAIGVGLLLEALIDVMSEGD